MALVHEQFAKAFAGVGAIAKGQKNAHHGYAYRGIDDVMNALHGVLAEHALFYVPRLVREDYEEWQTSKGNRLQLARGSYEFVFYAADGSDLVVGPVVGQSADTDDKAPMQALSQASKVALLQAFCVPTGDMAEGDSKSPVTADGGRSAAGASDKQVGMIKALVAKLPPDRQPAAEKWLGGLGFPDSLGKKDASTAITTLQQQTGESDAA